MSTFSTGGGGGVFTEDSEESVSQAGDHFSRQVDIAEGLVHFTLIVAPVQTPSTTPLVTTQQKWPQLFRTKKILLKQFNICQRA